MKDLKEIFNKIKDTVQCLEDLTATEEDRARWLDEFLDSEDARIDLDDETLDRIAREASKHVDE